MGDHLGVVHRREHGHDERIRIEQQRHQPCARMLKRGVIQRRLADVAKTAERGLFDQVFVADSPGIWHQGDDESFSRQGRVSHFEPVTLWAALSAVTKHIGFVATASTTYEDPFLLARKFASLDHISQGRAAWNVVTTSAEAVYGNFGLDAHPDPATRYERAHEFVDVVKGLWDSFEDDAFSRNKETGVYFDPQKLHKSSL